MAGSLLSYKDAQVKPKVLISFHYLPSFKGKAAIENWQSYQLMLDSGAYSAYNSKKPTDINALIEESKKPIWHESVALDVIGDGYGSLKNALKMKEAGSPSFPVFHITEPYELLQEYCAKFDKVGLSCRFGETTTDSLLWLDNCFSRCWPHKFHSFGWCEEKMLMRFPFHSADASSWVLGPMKFGRWKSLGMLRVRRPTKNGINLRAEIDEYMRMEQRLSSRWKKEEEKNQWTIKPQQMSQAQLF